MNVRSFTQSLLKSFGIIGFIFILAGCTSKGVLSTFDVKGPVAQMQLDLFMVTFWVSLFLFITVGGAFTYALIRYREKPSERNLAPPKTSTHGNPLVEGSLLIVSTICLVIIAIPTLRGIWFMEELPDYAETEGFVEVDVIGKQWWWEFTYRDELGSFTTANELVIPVNRPVQLNLRSGDVLHSFWIPQLAGKKDLTTGRKNTMWIQADEIGHYYGQCAEFCGEAHSYMAFRTRAMSEDDYTQWIDNQRQNANGPGGLTWEQFYAFLDNAAQDTATAAILASDPILDGARIFMTKGQCVQCHAIDGSRAAGVLGPNLTHFGNRQTVGAGLLDNRPEKTGEMVGMIDASSLEQWLTKEGSAKSGNLHLDNIYRWLRYSEKVKPGNLMYRSLRAEGFEYSDTEEAKMILSDNEIKRVSAYLQSLK